MSKLLWEIQINITTRLRFQVLLSGSTSEIWLSNESMPGTSSPDKVCKIVTHSIVLVCLWQKKTICCTIFLSNFQILLRHPRLAFDWLSVSFFDYWPIRMSGLLLLCTELTLFCTELPENCIYLNQSELSNFSMYIINVIITWAETKILKKKTKWTVRVLKVFMLS